MSSLIQGFAIIFILIGTFFSVVGVLGYIRLPDVYTRLHATGKVGVFGVVLLLIAAIIYTPFSLWRGLVLVLFLLITGPVTAHAISSTAYRIGLPMIAVRDDLASRRLYSTLGEDA